MKLITAIRVAAATVAIAGCLAGQDARGGGAEEQLRSQAVKAPVGLAAGRPANDLLTVLQAVPEGTHQPSPASLASLASKLAGNLRGRQLSPKSANQIAADTVIALRSAGFPAAHFKAAMARFEKELVGMHRRL